MRSVGDAKNGRTSNSVRRSFIQIGIITSSNLHGSGVIPKVESPNFKYAFHGQQIFVGPSPNGIEGEGLSAYCTGRIDYSKILYLHPQSSKKIPRSTLLGGIQISQILSPPIYQSQPVHDEGGVTRPPGISGTRCMRSGPATIIRTFSSGLGCPSASSRPLSLILITSLASSGQIWEIFGWTLACTLHRQRGVSWLPRKASP